LIGAPAAYAAGDLTSAEPAAAVPAAPDAVASAVATTAAVVEEATQPATAAPAVQAATTVAAETVAHARSKAAESVAATVERAREAAEPVLSTVSRVAPLTAVRPHMGSALTSTPRRAHVRVVAPTHAHHPAPLHVRALVPRHSAGGAIGSSSRVTVSRSSVARTPQLRSGLSVGSSPWPASRGGIDLSMGGAASGGISGVGLLLLAVAAALLLWMLAAHGARVRLNLDALRPTPLILHLERPD
jgi:hypothetical protein